MFHQWKISEKKCPTCKCSSVWHVGRILILKTPLTITWKSMIMDLELWGASPANNSWWWTVMMQQVVQAALHLGSPTGFNSLLMCYSVATYTPLFLEKSVLVAGINKHWLIDWVGVRKFFNKRSLRVLKMWVDRTIDLDLTIYVKQSHITCKLDPNKWISPILSCQKVYVENCSKNWSMIWLTPPPPLTAFVSIFYYNFRRRLFIWSNGGYSFVRV